MSKSREDAILRHGLALQRIFPHTKRLNQNGFAVWGPSSLYKRLHRLEAEAHTFAEKCCNEDVGDKKIERKIASILKRAEAILGVNVAITLNGDPRGYALKIDPKIMKAKRLEIQTDWGGYGIICPEF